MANEGKAIAGDAKGMGEPNVGVAEFVTGKNVIITIGINYTPKPDKANKANGDTSAQPQQGVKFSVPELFNCERDCKKLFEVLQRKYGFELAGELYGKDATLENIKTLFGNYIDNQVEDSNLIIYFSGHGYVYTKPNNEEVGCWVPSDCKGKWDDQFFRAQDLIDKLGYYNKPRHILVIVDACYAGKFTEAARYFPPNSDANKNDYGQTSERSRWIITSSRGNEVSLAGDYGGLSRFTNSLIEILEGNLDSDFSLNALMAELEKEFKTEEVHKPVHRPLQIEKYNSGGFTFYANSVELDKQLKREHLHQALPFLNYIEQPSSFPNLEEETGPLVALLSAPHDAGLSYLFKNFIQLSGNESSVFKEINPLAAGNAVDFFNNALGCECTTEAELLYALTTRFINTKVIIGISFRLGAFPVKVKRVLFEMLNGFAGLLKDKGLQTGPLCILVFDHDNLDYNLFKTEGHFNNIQLVDIGPVETMNSKKVMAWYNMYKVSRKEKGAEFHRLFNEPVKQLPVILNPGTESLPGSIIYQLCKNALDEKQAFEFFL